MDHGDFCIEVKHVKEVEGSILPSMLTFEGINFGKRHERINFGKNHEIKIKRFMPMGEMYVGMPSSRIWGLLYSFAAQCVPRLWTRISTLLLNN